MTRPEAEDAALPLDVLLTEAARGPLARLVPLAPAARLAAAALRSPAATAERAADLLAELGRIGLGARPAGGRTDDPRHADPAWTDDPLRSRLLQAHRATRRSALELVEDLAADEADADRLRVAVARLADLLAPGANPVLQPRWLREALRSRGASAVRAARAVAADLAAPPRLPDGGARLEPGAETATAPGAVVLRTPMVELIHYLPATEQVAEVPVLVVPGVVNRFHLVDLAPDRSLVRRLVAAGQQVFALSWRDPGPGDAGWGLDAYAGAVVEALGACERICRVDRTTLLGFSTGGLLAAAVTARLERQERVAALVLAGTTLDRERSRTGPSAAPVDDAEVRAAVAAVGRAGLLDGRRLAEIHALLCPEALVWPAWERRYLGGTEGPPDALRAWNLDALHVPAALFRDLAGLALSGALSRPGAARVLGGPVDLSAVDRDVYLLAGVADRVGSWQAVYRTSQVLGGKSRVVTVPGSTAAAVGYGTNAHRVAAGAVSAGNPADAERWRGASHVEQGSWWEDLVTWLGERSGAVVDAPPELGGRGLHPIHPAPGTYL
ncbi:alpha/beta fold hydrolase [Pseudonocardia sp. RS010]|uniref:alpha/beta fold hydrolase n=1 Tax=Pseudonocardia sp. RS010 TaxID=3385979 RepID=UPI0039A15033